MTDGFLRCGPIAQLKEEMGCLIPISHRRLYEKRHPGIALLSYL